MGWSVSRFGVIAVKFGAEEAARGFVHGPDVGHGDIFGRAGFDFREKFPGCKVVAGEDEVVQAGGGCQAPEGHGQALFTVLFQEGGGQLQGGRFEYVHGQGRRGNG